jgi:hypothetical protein
MKTIRRILPCFLLLLAACASSCAGTLARQNVQLPALQNTWSRLRPAAERQVLAEHDDALDAAIVAADGAMATGDPVQMLTVDWKRIERAVELDVARQLATGQLGPLGAESRRGLLVEFAQERATYTRTAQ